MYCNHHPYVNKLTCLIKYVFPKSYSKALQHHSSSARNYFLDRKSNEETTIENAITHTTHTRIYRRWDRWILFLHLIELKDEPFLNNIEEENRPSLIRDFIAAVREREFSKKDEKDLLQGTTKEYIDKVDEFLR